MTSLLDKLLLLEVLVNSFITLPNGLNHMTLAMPKHLFNAFMVRTHGNIMDHGTSTLDIVLSNQVARFMIQPGNKDTHLETKPEELKELLDIWLKKSHKASLKK